MSEALLPALLEVWRSPECRRFVGAVAWLSSVSAGFWLLARGMGAAVEVFSELFWEPLWGAFATVYNITLAIFFAAILFAAAGDQYWRQACGFVALYLSLSASYTDPVSGVIDDTARPGYAAALVAYVFFAAVPSLVSHPALHELIAVMKAVADSWVGTASAVLVTGGVLFRLFRGGLRAMFRRLSPFLWFIGALKHPPIRVRDDG
ncbi:MAG: hypothetical protein SF051_16725 [Elusimicrobiota bacterium]|nr:hypothetical protein [Elusimicrobiota bacterium]